MKLSEFDFRIWDKDEKCFLDPYTKSRAVVKNLPNEKLLNLEIELFTGLYDKNGKKIYEGDIVSYITFQGTTLFYFVTINKDINIFEIFRIANLEKFELYNTTESDRFSLYLFSKINDMKDIEVIGNIHNKAELLEVKELK
ncbi:hypothetical protein CE427_07230 [Campylobacter coli]|nr:hypothetical protein [Campylobacter coli]